MDIPALIQAKIRGKKWAVLTAYDFPTGEAVDAAGADFVLVGDSLGMVVLGYLSTRDVTMDEMIHHAKAVRRGVKKALVIGDLPLKGIEKGPNQALRSARRFMQEAGCDAVKVEWSERAPAILERLRREKIPVMGHVGLTPQSVPVGGPFKVKGALAEEAAAIYEAALTFEKLGAFSVVLECVPEPVAARITKALKIPTIGIGAGRFCDGQVLVFHDVTGIFNKFSPRFVKRYAELGPLMRKAVSSFVLDTAKGRFPAKCHVYEMPKEALKDFDMRIKNRKGKGR